MVTIEEVRSMTQDELDAAIASGKLQRVHLYGFENVLRPRGSMQKESLGEYILERLKRNWETWSEENYADNPDPELLLETLYNNLMNESVTAYEEFTKWIQMKL